MNLIFFLYIGDIYRYGYTFRIEPWNRILHFKATK